VYGALPFPPITLICDTDTSTMPDDIAAVGRTAEYYDTASVSDFYRQCWGGEDIHIGLYATGKESVAEASTAMTRHLLDSAGIRAGMSVLDIACGYGGTLRVLAEMGCAPVRGIDISASNVAYAREANLKAGLDAGIEVEIGDFHAIGGDADTWDAVVCQDSIIHSPDRPAVFRDVFRVLRPGGTFAFSDLLTGTSADIDKVKAAFARIGATADATIGDYEQMARTAGFEIIRTEERQDDIRTHYDRLAARLAEPVAGLDTDALDAISQSIERWRNALAGGDITWALFVARKPG